MEKVRYYKGKIYRLIEGKECPQGYIRLEDITTRVELLVPDALVLTVEQWNKKKEGPHPYHVTW